MTTITFANSKIIAALHSSGNMYMKMLERIPMGDITTIPGLSSAKQAATQLIVASLERARSRTETVLLAMDYNLGFTGEPKCPIKLLIEKTAEIRSEDGVQKFTFVRNADEITQARNNGLTPIVLILTGNGGLIQNTQVEPGIEILTLEEAKQHYGFDIKENTKDEYLVNIIKFTKWATEMAKAKHAPQGLKRSLSAPHKSEHEKTDTNTTKLKPIHEDSDQKYPSNDETVSSYSLYETTPKPGVTPTTSKTLTDNNEALTSIADQMKTLSLMTLFNSPRKRSVSTTDESNIKAANDTSPAIHKKKK